MQPASLSEHPPARMSPELSSRGVFWNEKPRETQRRSRQKVKRVDFKAPVAPKSKQENAKRTERHRKNH